MRHGNPFHYGLRMWLRRGEQALLQADGQVRVLEKLRQRKREEHHAEQTFAWFLERVIGNVQVVLAKPLARFPNGIDHGGQADAIH